MPVACEEIPISGLAYARGLRQLNENNLTQAARHFHEALAAQPNYPAAHHAIGICYFRSQDFARAEYHFRKTVELQNNHHAAHYYLGLTLEHRGDSRSALQEYQLALAIKPDFKEAQERVDALSPDSEVPHCPASKTVE